jgi:phosphoglycerate dehydrogenase-like enzyme
MSCILRECASGIRIVMSNVFNCNNTENRRNTEKADLQLREELCNILFVIMLHVGETNQTRHMIKVSTLTSSDNEAFNFDYGNFM